MLINNIPVNYTDEGEGIPLVFLHGFMESLAIWKEYSVRFSKNFRVICIDLPGHGKSGCAKHTHTIDFMSEIVNSVLVRLKVRQCFLIGHSMGGYVTLSFAERFPNKLLGYCLFHSHPYEDSEQKKRDRSKAAKIVTWNPSILIAEMIPNLFTKKNTLLFTQEAENMKDIAVNMRKDGIIKAIEGMIERKDQQDTMANSTIPIHIIIGKNDRAMNYDVIKHQLNLSPKITSLVLKNAGHLGFIEAKEECYKSLHQFFNHKNCKIGKKDERRPYSIIRYLESPY